MHIWDKGDFERFKFELFSKILIKVQKRIYKILKFFKINIFENKFNILNVKIFN